MHARLLQGGEGGVCRGDVIFMNFVSFIIVCIHFVYIIYFITMICIWYIHLVIVSMDLSGFTVH